ncbi:MAG: glycogen/starch synthase, partial [Bacteroidota bacterium]
VINERRNRLHEVVRLSGINISVGSEEKPLTIKVASIPNARLQVYFLDNDDYFKRRAVLANAKSRKFFDDNADRTVFFCKGALETVKKLGWSPDIVHCHGWMTALIPLYLKTHYAEDPIFVNSKSVYTMYNHQVDFPMPDNFADMASYGSEGELLKPYDTGSYRGFVQGALKTADRVARGHQQADAGVEEYIKSEGIDVPYDKPEPNVEAYVDFYDQIYQDLLKTD